jgi:hypothetical protein
MKAAYERAMAKGQMRRIETFLEFTIAIAEIAILV